jgi:hypothetical protein
MQNQRQILESAVVDARRAVVAAQRARFIAERRLAHFDNREIEMEIFYQDCHSLHP